MKRLREFMGTTTRIDYDAERGTFDSVGEVHPFLDRGEADSGLTASVATSVKAADERATEFGPERGRQLHHHPAL